LASFSKINIFGVIRPPVVTIVILLIWMIKYLLFEFRSQVNLRIESTPPVIPHD
jgi:hypothetical protein